MTISKAQNTILHVAKGKLGWDDALYRQAPVRIAGVTSSNDLDCEGFEALMGWLKKYHKVDSMRFVTMEAARKTITALKAWKGQTETGRLKRHPQKSTGAGRGCPLFFLTPDTRKGKAGIQRRATGLFSGMFARHCAMAAKTISISVTVEPWAPALTVREYRPSSRRAFP